MINQYVAILWTVEGSQGRVPIKYPHKVQSIILLNDKKKIVNISCSQQKYLQLCFGRVLRSLFEDFLLHLRPSGAFFKLKHSSIQD